MPRTARTWEFWEAFECDPAAADPGPLIIDTNRFAPVNTGDSTITQRAEARYFTWGEVADHTPVPDALRAGWSHDQYLWANGFCTFAESRDPTISSYRQCAEVVDGILRTNDLVNATVAFPFVIGGQAAVALTMPPFWPAAPAAGDVLVREWRIDVHYCCPDWRTVGAEGRDPDETTTVVAKPEIQCYE